MPALCWNLKSALCVLMLQLLTGKRSSATAGPARSPQAACHCRCMYS